MSLMHVHPQPFSRNHRSSVDRSDDTRLALSMIVVLLLSIIIAFASMWLRIRALNPAPVPDRDDTAAGRVIVLVAPAAALLIPAIKGRAM